MFLQLRETEAAAGAVAPPLGATSGALAVSIAALLSPSGVHLGAEWPAVPCAESGHAVRAASCLVTAERGKRPASASSDARISWLVSDSLSDEPHRDVVAALLDEDRADVAGPAASS